MKLEFGLRTTKRTRRKRGGLKNGWRPENSQIYAEKLGDALAIAGDVWQEDQIQLKCDAIEKVLVDIAKECQENKHQGTQENRHSAIKELIEERMAARRIKDKDKVTELSKIIQFAEYNKDGKGRKDGQDFIRV